MVKSHEDVSHFLLSILNITEGPTNKIMRKSGIPSSVPCRDSTLEQFLFCFVFVLFVFVLKGVKKKCKK